MKTLTFISFILLWSVCGIGQWLSTSDFFPVSVWYSGGKSRAPMLSEITPISRIEWLRDLRQIKSLGFNTVRTWVEWAHCEPRPNEYHFENLRLLCELAREVGLRVIVQMYIDSAPDWVAKKYPDGLFEAQSGDKVKPQSAPGCCTDHAGVRQAVLNFYTETARVAASYDNFFGWDLWSEPHIINWAYINYVPNVQFCYCPHTQAVFRTYLQNKYGTLEALNKAWYRNFAAWADVEAPRFGTILSYTDFIDWKNFIYEKLANDLRMRYEAVRKADSIHVITSHAAVPSIFYSPYVGYGATDDFLMAEQVDYYGTSLYPKHNRPST
ncbi:beta-galactosidase, partial [candidate division KSB1 bacterium]|nr:beta-galactosidase [candidate division KSB1 bacterium]